MTEAERVTRALNGEWRGNNGLAPCPICQPEGRRDQRALSLSDSAGRLLCHCHKSGCAVLSELQVRGLIDGKGAPSAPPDPAAEARRRAEEKRRDARRRESARTLFAEGVSCFLTPAQTYLESRGLTGMHFNRLRSTLRYHPSVLHSPSGLHLPAMLAQIRGPKGEALGIHRTFLKPDGSGKADVEPAKMMLGPSSGGAVRFGPDNRVIALAEGIETALSVSRSSRMTVWATLSTSGLKGLILPPAPVAEVVIIAADHDDAGLSAAEIVAGRLEAEGRAVSIIHPQKQGTDFNDLLRGDA
ncbi:virulence-associated protein E [Ketogulonicigenium robustum]|uniref:Virulence-associated protein E n=1 Tax=Ketogulonicigenium robustum TaxID=92947 RepID=A0A1W6NWP9_9RHOB|nr:toprim domain-containing protein [Ketogulonicigenium robustum]ARO13530.1 virulence-associated protein E [Ketogulonicigenium robustum]